MSSSGQFSIEKLSPAEWQVFVAGAASPVPFSSLWWADAVSSATGLSSEFIGIRKNNSILAGCCIYYSSGSRNKFARHPPLTPYNTIILERGFTQSSDSAIFAALSALGNYLSAEYIYPYLLLDPGFVDTRPLQWSGWKVAPGYTYVVLPGNTVIDSDIKRRSRRCAEDGFYIKEDFNISAFSHLFRLTSERQGIRTKLTSEEFNSFLLNIAASGSAFMLTSYDRSGIPHASWIQVSANNETVYNWNAASDPALLSKGGTPFLATALLENIKHKNFSKWDLCGADHPSVAKFKSGLGGDLTPYYKIDYSSYGFLQKLIYRMKR